MLVEGVVPSIIYIIISNKMLYLINKDKYK